MPRSAPARCRPIAAAAGLAALTATLVAPAGALRGHVRAIVRYAGLGLESDARLRLHLFREQVARHRSAGRLSHRQARALTRFTRRAADVLEL